MNALMQMQGNEICNHLTTHWPKNGIEESSGAGPYYLLVIKKKINSQIFP
jgi:hypothetical protein